ncbi:hypothetical protein [Microlunatus soli]|uniref:Uncharacterized protein n=1 Tax=Microlunatus soli TaxID=630515 RepID=A0A1H1MHY6_9ACTN|nr:hypothetical protein [Microlunatus soli]SDR85579.1 hypothetical protein SAMN04489812_0119 [Microlunatus soli]
MSTQPTDNDKSQLRLAELFDIRTVIGTLFLIYGAVCLITGIIDFSAADSTKAGGINVNLWSGIGQLIIAAIFIVWSLTKPFHPPSPDSETGPDQQS